MTLSNRTFGKLLRTIECLNAGLDSRRVRHDAGEALLDLLGADYFASYVWDEGCGEFRSRVQINMSDENLSAYEAYFQFRDPITMKLKAQRRATAVSSIMAQRDLERTEFFNDFLARDGLHYGMNLFVYDGERNIGDLRVWRRRGRGNFESRDVETLDLIRPHFRNAMRNIRAAGKRNRLRATGGLLTPRETDVAAAIARGMSDAEVAASLGMAYSTLRTHLKRIYRKLGVHNRTAMIARLAG